VSDSGGTDTIKFDDAWSPEDIGSGANDLIFEDANGNSLTVSSQYFNSDDAVQSAHFSDSTVWNLLTMIIETHGTSGDDSFCFEQRRQPERHDFHLRRQRSGGSWRQTTSCPAVTAPIPCQAATARISSCLRVAKTGSDTISDFSTTDGAKLHIHEMLTGYRRARSPIREHQLKRQRRYCLGRCERPDRRFQLYPDRHIGRRQCLGRS
jgi:hypothetical protein